MLANGALPQREGEHFAARVDRDAVAGRMDVDRAQVFDVRSQLHQLENDRPWITYGY